MRFFRSAVSLSTVLRLLLLVLLLVLVLFPMVWIVRVSMRTQVRAFQIPQPVLFAPIADNYVRLLTRGKFAGRFVNSFVESSLSVVLVLAIGVPAAYVFSRLRFRFKNALFVAILTSRMIPPIALLVPYFMVFNRIGLIDTRIGMNIVFAVMNIGLVVWALWSFFDEIPVELDESAEMDGATALQTLVRVIVPIGAPGITSVAILAFVSSWNNYLFPLILTRSRAATAPVELAAKALSYQSQDLTLVAAGCVIVAAPAVVFTFIIRKYMRAGLTAGAIKG